MVNAKQLSASTMFILHRGSVDTFYFILSLDEIFDVIGHLVSECHLWQRFFVVQLVMS